MSPRVVQLNGGAVPRGIVQRTKGASLYALFCWAVRHGCCCTQCVRGVRTLVSGGLLVSSWNVRHHNDRVPSWPLQRW
jgi:hypothetical protein